MLGKWRFHTLAIIACIVLIWSIAMAAVATNSIVAPNGLTITAKAPNTTQAVVINSTANYGGGSQSFFELQQSGVQFFKVSPQSDGSVAVNLNDYTGGVHYTILTTLDGMMKLSGASTVGVKPDTDSTGTIGAASARFLVGYFGAAVGSRPTCDATTRGGTMTIFASAGASDTFQVCMKAAADTYAWRTVFTAP